MSRRRLLWLLAGAGVTATGLWRPWEGADTPPPDAVAGAATPAPTPSPVDSAATTPVATADPEPGPAVASESPSASPSDIPVTDPSDTSPTSTSEAPSDEQTPSEDTAPTEPAAPSDPAASSEPAASPEPGSPAPASDEPSDRPSGARDIICRDALQIPPGTDEGRPHTPTRLMLHHTAVSSTSASQAPDRLRGHTRYHQQQGWPTIAYHYGVDLNGNLYELRDVNIAGDTFTAYDPAGWFLVVCEGDFNSTRPTDRLLDGVATMLTHGAATFGIDPATLAGHRDHASTTCPGDLLYAHRDALVAEVQRRLGAGDASLPRICGEEADQRVAAIESGQA